MTRLGYLLACVLLGSGAALLSCGSSTGPNAGTATDSGTSTTVVTLESLVPLENQVTGWKIDPNNGKTASAKPAVFATTQKATEELIDGSAEDFWGEKTADKVPQKFGWQNYVNASLVSPQGSADGSTLQLLLFEMPSDAAAAGLYAWLVKNNQYPLWNEQWEEPTSPVVGTKSRVANSGSDWWINFYKGRFYCEVRLTPSYGPSPDFAEKNQSQKDAMFTFAKYLAGKM